MKINTKQNQQLKQLAHHLKPVVIIGEAGLSEAVLEEIRNALAFHELIKVKINSGDRIQRSKMCGNISIICHCHHVQTIGRIAIFYRQSEKKKISLIK